MAFQVRWVASNLGILHGAWISDCILHTTTALTCCKQGIWEFIGRTGIGITFPSFLAYLPKN